MESKQCTPSVIARLMDLDELPPQQPVYKQQKVLSENYFRKTASIGCYEGRSFRRNGVKQQEFKDVFEVPGIPKIEKRHIWSVQRGKANSSVTKLKRASMRKKLTDAKHLSVDDKLQYSIEFDDVLEELDSNKSTSNSLFTRHPCLQSVKSHAGSGDIITLKSVNAPNCRGNEICRKSEKITAEGIVLKSLQKPENGLATDFSGERGIDYSNEMLKSQLKDGSGIPHQKIAILEQNFGNEQNAVGSSCSSGSHEVLQLCDRKYKGLPWHKNGELYNEEREREGSANVMKYSRLTFGVSAEYSKDITTEIKHSIRSSFMEVSRLDSGFHETYANESDVVRPFCPGLSDWKSHHQSSSNRSSFGKEAKKRSSEHWKMAKTSQEPGAVGRSSTLREMLAVPDRETKADKHGLDKHFSLDSGDSDLGSTFGISSRDGWKDMRVRNLPSFRTLHAACVDIRSLKSKPRNEAPSNELWLRSGGTISRGKNDQKKQIFSHKVSSKPRYSRSSCAKFQSLPCLDSENNNTVLKTHAVIDELEIKLGGEDPYGENSIVSGSSNGNAHCSDLEYLHLVQEAQVIKDELKNSLEENNLSESRKENCMAPNSSINIVAPASMAAEVVSDAETTNLVLSSETHEEQLSASTAACIQLVKDAQSSPHVFDASVGQESSTGLPAKAFIYSNCPRMDPDLTTSLGENFSPSPNSVLELPFQEETSYGSECFESVSAELDGLRVQLQLLKSESEEANSDGPGLVVSSDEDSREGSIDLSEESRKLIGIFRVEESRDFSYMVDILDEAGFDGGNWGMGIEKWHSLEWPVNPSVFETLEKKYGKQTSWAKSERRLLFDHLNTGLLQILKPCMDTTTLSKPVRKRFNLSWSREVIEEELWMLLVSQEKEVHRDLSEKALGGKFQCLELQEDIDAIVREIERYLVDELAAELIGEP